MSPNNTGTGGNNGPGPIGPSPSNNNIGLFSGPAFLNFMAKGDLTYQSTSLMGVYLNQCKIWTESLEKALKAATIKDHPNYSCLNCKMPGKKRNKQNGLSSFA